MEHSPIADAERAKSRGNESWRIADFDEQVQRFPGWTGRFEQLSRGQFDGTMRIARGRELSSAMTVILVVPGSAAAGATAVSRRRPGPDYCAEEARRDRLRTAITDGDLCRNLGVYVRTLRMAFQERLGMGPMANCQTLRLNAAWTVRKASDSEVSVADVARTLGYHHVGKFAGYNRRFVGGLPSAIVR
ncbi:MAG: helix-turn-helix domain-containing protein [Gemmataceae bacterium]